MIFIRRSSYEYSSSDKSQKKILLFRTWSNNVTVANQFSEQMFSETTKFTQSYIRLKFLKKLHQQTPKYFEHFQHDAKSIRFDHKSLKKKPTSYLKRKRHNHANCHHPDISWDSTMSRVSTFLFKKKTSKLFIQTFFLFKKHPKFKRCNLFKTNWEAKIFFCFLAATKRPKMTFLPGQFDLLYKMRSLTSNVNLLRQDIWLQMSTSQNDKLDFKCQLSTIAYKSSSYPKKTPIGKDWSDLE